MDGIEHNIDTGGLTERIVDPNDIVQGPRYENEKYFPKWLCRNGTVGLWRKPY